MTPRGALLALAALLAASPAPALTCAPSTPLRAFRAARAAPDSYIVVSGRLSFDPARMPGSEGTADRSVHLSARLVGQSLAADGFTAPFARSVTLSVHCIAYWCGSAEPGASVLAYLRLGGGRPLLQLDPCPQWTFRNPADATLRAVAACYAGEGCTAER